MALQEEKSYTTKDGVTKNFNYPLIKLMGKNMDDDETLKFQVLKLPQKKLYTKFEYYTMFVKTPNTDSCKVLEFGLQLKNLLDHMQIQARDILTFSKGAYTNPNTGASQPIVQVKIENRQNKAIPIVPDDKEIKDFVKGYKEQVKPSDWSVSHFVGSYIRKFSPNVVEHLEKLYKEEIQV